MNMAKEILSQTKNFSKIYAVNAANGIALKDCDGMEIPVKALAICKDSDKKTGEIKEVGVIVSENDETYSTISDMAMDIIEDCMEFVDEGTPLKFRVTVRKSKGADRDYIALTALIS